MHAEVDPRQTNQQEHCRAHSPDRNARAARLNSRRNDRRQRSEENGARQRMSTRKAVRLRSRKVEEWNRSGTFEGQLQRDIQQPGADHCYRKELRFSIPLLHRETNNDDDRPNRQRQGRADKRQPAHGCRKQRRRKLMDCRSRRVVKPARVALERLVSQPAKEN